MSICLDSVFNDSRCTTGVYCIWAGNGTVRFKYEKYKNKPVIFDLNTNSQFRSDTIVDGYKFTLVGLSPYPAIGHQIIQKNNMEIGAAKSRYIYKIRLREGIIVTKYGYGSASIKKMTTLASGSKESFSIKSDLPH